jgi:hypothetical protein
VLLYQNESKAGNMSVIMDIKYCNADPLAMNYILGGGGGGIHKGDFPTTEEIGVEEKREEFLCPLSWSIHHNLARDGYIKSTCVCAQAGLSGMVTKILFSLLW